LVYLKLETSVGFNGKGFKKMFSQFSYLKTDILSYDFDCFTIYLFNYVSLNSGPLENIDAGLRLCN